MLIGSFVAHWIFDMKINDFLSAPFTFSKRKEFVPCDVRPLWKMTLIILIVGTIKKNEACSLNKLHVANWVIKNINHFQDFINWSRKKTVLKPEIRLEPSVDRALELLVSEKLLEKSSGKIVMTELGIKTYDLLIRENIFSSEKLMLKDAAKYLTDANINRIFKVS